MTTSFLASEESATSSRGSALSCRRGLGQATGHDCLSAPTRSRLSRSSAIYPLLYAFGFNLSPQTDGLSGRHFHSARSWQVPSGRLSKPETLEVIGISAQKRQKRFGPVRLAPIPDFPAVVPERESSTQFGRSNATLLPRQAAPAPSFVDLTLRHRAQTWSLSWFVPLKV